VKVKHQSLSNRVDESRMPSAVRWLSVVTLLTLAACGSRGDTSTALNPPKIDTLPGGIVHVTNTGPTAWRDTSGWHWKPVAVIKPAEGSSGELGEIASVAIGDDGSVYALQKQPAVIKVFGSDGAYVRTIGREGDGPGELRRGFLAIRGDTLLIQDSGNSRLTIFRTDGTLLHTVVSPCCFYWPPFVIDSIGRAWIPGRSQNNTPSWFRIRMNGSTADTVAMPPMDDFSKMKRWEITVTRGSNQLQMIMPAPMQPGTLFAPRSDGAIVSGSTGRYQFAILRSAADTIRIVDADAPAVTITEAQRDTIFARATAQRDEVVHRALLASAHKDDIPHTWLPWTHMALDGDGHLWVALPGAAGEVSRLQVFDREGRLLGDVSPANPKMFDLTAAWGRDRIAVPDEDDAGRPIIRTYRLAHN
jgi:hypothetical protein